MESTGLSSVRMTSKRTKELRYTLKARDERRNKVEFAVVLLNKTDIDSKQLLRLIPSKFTSSVTQHKKLSTCDYSSKLGIARMEEITGRQ